ncbi:hypothetical protein ACWEJ6_52830 [Nonomuraea sp. NPDC004702]
MTESSSAYMAILGDREALGWILQEQRMAFGPERWKLWRELKQGDALALYTTRQCFRNPTRDRGRIIGTAIVSTPISRMIRPVEFRDKNYEFSCNLNIDQLAPWGQGLELAAFVEQLHTFPNAWQAYIRRSLVRLNKDDFEFISGALARDATTRDEALQSYLLRAIPVQSPGRPPRKEPSE